MTSSDIRDKFLKFFEERGHKIVPSSSLIPTDPSVLLTTAGMQQFKPYFVGKADPLKDFGSKNTASIQKCFRTSDIDEVGDESHLTFFEMLGNFSFGYKSGEPSSLRDGYFKKEAIAYAHEFITKELGLKIDYVSVFKGDSEVPKDEESEKIWRSLGVKEIKYAGREDNFWGPTGAEGPCGPTTEIYINNVEIWNIVFNEYYMYPDKHLEPLKQKGVDTGMGLERLVMVAQNKKNIFDTDLFESLINQIYLGDIRMKRIVADHIRAGVHLIADGVEPSNKGREYILRRLLRRTIFHLADFLKTDVQLHDGVTPPELNKRVNDALDRVIDTAVSLSPYLRTLDTSYVKIIISKEVGKSVDILKSIYELRRAIEQCLQNDKEVFPSDLAFKFSSSYGTPLDFIKDEVRKVGLKFNEKRFNEEFKKHQEISRAGMEKKFGGHGLVLNTGELKAGSEEELNKVLRLHTATHLLQRALREVLGPEIKQAGSDITPERTRFDFSFPRKMTPEEIKKVEDLVNEKIKEDLPVSFKEMPKSDAEKTGALYFFKEKYPDKVKVYYVGKSLESAWSKEFCGGPHVKNTGEIGHFKISKEESVGAGLRRVRGVLE